MLSNVAFKESLGGRSALWMVAIALLAALVVVGLLAPRAYAAPSTFIVNSTADPGTGGCDATECTLREAIEAANTNNNPTEKDLIKFNISGTGVKTITPASALPEIVEPVIINGYSQPGSSVNTRAKGTNAKLLIELNGTNAGSADGLSTNDGASGTTIRGLVINRFVNQGMNIANSSIESLTDVKIAGNFVGTDPSGTSALPNGGDGIEMDASNSVVGGSTPATRNLISGNDVDGLSVSGDAKDVQIRGNLVGTKADGVSALGNLFNGVDVSGGSVGVSILTNSIFSNGQLGIDLGVNGRTNNDPGDGDTGANDLQNFPVITSAKTASGKTTVKGTLNSNPNATYTVQFFSNPSGTDEGRTFLGQKSVTTNGNGNASFTFSPSNEVQPGRTITATATRNSNGNTSEFSDPRTVVSA